MCLTEKMCQRWYEILHHAFVIPFFNSIMQKRSTKKKARPGQHQNRQPGLEWKMNPPPEFLNPELFKEKRLLNKVTVITGGDSGIGRSVAVSFARHGALVCILYLNEDRDANETQEFIEKELKGKCIAVACDISEEKNCIKAIRAVKQQFGHIDVLVNNAAIHYPQDDISKITAEQLEKTFRTNVFSMFYLVKAALPFMKEGSSIINTSSVTAYRGSAHLIDYAATKGAIVSFTRSLSSSLAEKKIRVNGVAPGPIWTPLIPASFPAKEVSTFGSDVPLKRAGQPSEVAPCFVFLASDESSYMTGQFLHPNGGEIING
jgi:NAD(P)-dependent dehydrogenase (short-subunit alcohol dehydrogenase family)